MPVKMEDNINFTTEKVKEVILKINNRMIN
jgi:hypothetical protein